VLVGVEDDDDADADADADEGDDVDSSVGAAAAEGAPPSSASSPSTNEDGSSSKRSRRSISALLTRSSLLRCSSNDREIVFVFMLILTVPAAPTRTSFSGLLLVVASDGVFVVDCSGRFSCLLLVLASVKDCMSLLRCCFSSLMILYVRT